jgi:hypothetical protein
MLALNVQMNMMYATRPMGCIGKKVRVEQLEMNCVQIGQKFYQMGDHLGRDLVELIDFTEDVIAAAKDAQADYEQYKKDYNIDLITENTVWEVQ